jgi:hypothetical protein
MVTDAPTPPDDGPVADQSPEAIEARHRQGPFQVTLPPGFERNPGLPPEVWAVPPPGVEPPKFEGEGQ